MLQEFPVLIGLHKDDAYRFLGQHHKNWRLAEEDGRQFYIRENEPFKRERINLYIKNSIIVDFKYY